MPMPGDHKPPDDLFEQIEKKDFANGIYGLCRLHSACFWPFLRSGMGSHALAWPGPFALVGMFGYAGVTESPEMIVFMAVWLLAVIVGRLRTDRTQHSLYDGWPSLTMRMFPFVKTEDTARMIEPAFCLLAGALLLSVSHPLGVFVMAGWVSMTLKEGIERMLHANRVRQLRDSAIEQQALSRGLRRGR